jgi:single-stranded DNA-binding protein
MISIFASGSLINKPALRTSRNGNEFVACQMRCAAGNENFLVSLVAFDELISKALAALNRGDSVSITGTGKPSTWTGRDGEPCLGLSMKVEQLMTQYSLTKKRGASQGDQSQYGLPAQSPLLDAETDGAPF